MNYFDHTYVSNSDLKELVAVDRGIEKPANIQEIYDAGTLNHMALLEPYKAKRWLDHQHDLFITRKEAFNKIKQDYDLASKMAETVLKDKLCRDVIVAPDLRREHEFYRIRNPFGLDGVRCKCDAESRIFSLVFEYKGLGVTSESAFDNAIIRFDYDQSAAWYLETTRDEYYLIVGVSKKKPDKLFKRLIDRTHAYYRSGFAKCIRGAALWRSYGLK